MSIVVDAQISNELKLPSRFGAQRHLQRVRGSVLRTWAGLSAALLILRLFLCVTFLVAAFAKLTDSPDSRNAIEHFREPAWLPSYALNGPREIGCCHRFFARLDPHNLAVCSDRRDVIGVSQNKVEPACWTAPPSLNAGRTGKEPALTKERTCV